MDGLYYASSFYDQTYTGTQDEWICFQHTIEAGDDCLCFYAMGSTCWAIDSYQNYDIFVTINGVDFCDYHDDNDGAVTWQWQRYCVDLGVYSVGQIIEICFGYVGYDGAQGSFDAVSIGECPHPPQPCCPFMDICYTADFNETSCHAMLTQCEAGVAIWEWGVPVGIPTVACDDVPVTNVLGTMLGGNYASSSGHIAAIGPYAITPDCHCLELCHYYDIEDGYDGGNVKVSADAGTTWYLVCPHDGYDDVLDSIYDIADCVHGEQVFTGNSVTFVRDCFDLTDYIGESVLVGLFFGSDSSSEQSGWYIKWVKIGGGETAVEDSSWGAIKAMYR